MNKEKLTFRKPHICNISGCRYAAPTRVLVLRVTVVGGADADTGPGSIRGQVLESRVLASALYAALDVRSRFAVTVRSRRKAKLHGRKNPW